MKQPNIERMTVLLEEVLDAMGIDRTDANFTGTPNRIARAWTEMCSGLWDGSVESLFDAVFPSQYDQMIVERNIDVVGLCPHHFLPVEMTVHIAYIPNEKGMVVGISKLARLARILSCRPVLQEDLPEDIAKYIMRHLKPLGCGVVVVGKHGCMRCRGVYAKDADVITSVMKGVFLAESVVRLEFFNLIGDLK